MLQFPSIKICNKCITITFQPIINVFKPLHSPSMQLQLKLAVYATNEHVTKTKIVFEV